MASTSHEFCRYRSPLPLSKEDSRISQHDPLVYSPLAGQEFNQHAWIYKNLAGPRAEETVFWLYSGRANSFLFFQISRFPCQVSQVVSKKPNIQTIS